MRFVPWMRRKMSQDRRRILVAVDGSEQTQEAVSYLSGIVPSFETSVVLFHVMNRVPDAFWDWEKDPLTPTHLDYLKDWEMQKENRIRQFMRQARRVLVDVGIPEYSVMISIQKIREGIARDILTEAQRGYDAVVVGRTGLGGIDERMLGSVAGKTTAKLDTSTVWLVGGKPRKGKILIAMDSSSGAMRAVDHVCRMAAVKTHSISLLHVVRGISVTAAGQEQIFPEGYRQRLLEEAENEIRPAFEEATERLKAAGVKAERISIKVISGVASRAGAIIEEARQGGFGTIVVGRKGLSGIEEFDMGRVTFKLTQIAGNMALWVVA